MKKTIAIVFMAISTSVFGSQQTQVAESRARHIREVQRARAERIKREGERAERVERANILEIEHHSSQSLEAAIAREKARREVQRARAERNARIINSRIIVEESKKSCPVVIMPNGIICRTIHHTQYGFGLGEFGIGEGSSYTENKTLKIKQNSRLRSNDPRWGNRNLNTRKFKLSSPARRRK